MNVNVLIFFGVVLGFALGITASHFVGFTRLLTEAWAFTGALLGAVLTVFAAIAVTHYQLNSRRQELEEDRRRQQRGARTILASDLSRIIDYTESSATAARRAAQVASNGQDGRVLVPCPSLDQDVLIRLQKLVELLDGPDADQIADMMYCYQVQHARLSGALTSLNEPAQRAPGLVLGGHSFYFTFGATVELFLRAENMFSFARRRQEFIAPPPYPEDRLNFVLQTLGIDDLLPNSEYQALLDRFAGP